MDAKLIAIIFAVILGLLNMIIFVVKQFGRKQEIKEEVKVEDNPYPCQKHEDKMDELGRDINRIKVDVGKIQTSLRSLKEDNKEEHRRLFRKINSEGG